MDRGKTCAHPHSRTESAWWWVDLAGHNPSQRFVIKEVKIYFRSDCCTGGKKCYEVIEETYVRSVQANRYTYINAVLDQ